MTGTTAMTAPPPAPPGVRPPAGTSSAVPPSAFAAGSRAAVLAAVGAVTFFAFWPLRAAQFLRFDDPSYVLDNPFVSAGLTWQGLRWAATSIEVNWHPLTYLSHMLDCQLFGLDAGAHHLMAVALHVANSVLLGHVLFRLSGAFWPGVFVAALFALHPLHVESVAWISERKDLLSAGCWFLAMLAHLRYAERPSRSRAALVAVWMLLGLMSKGMIVTLPLTLLLLDYWPLRRWPPAGDGAAAPWRSAWLLVWEKLPLFVIAGVGAAIQIVSHGIDGGIRSLDDLSLARRCANILLGYARYAAKMVWPSDLIIPYPYPHEMPPAWQLAAAAVWAVGVSVAVLRWGRTHRYLVTGWLWYVITLLPVIGIVQAGPQSIADRYTYVPLIGLFIIVAWGAAEWAPRGGTVRRALPPAAALVLLACAALTRRQVRLWHDGVSLFAHTVAAAPDNAEAELYLGGAYAAAGRNDEAGVHFAAALRLKPESQIIRDTLAMFLLYEGRFAEAETHLRELQRMMPDYAPVRVNLGIARMQQGDPAGAREYFQAAIALAPDSASTHYRLAQALEAEGRLDEALPAYATALRLDATLPGLRARYAAALRNAGRLADAIAQYRDAVAREPGNADLANELGAALQTAGQREEARAHFAAALRLDPNAAEAHNNLGVLLFEDGHAAEAEQHFREALRLRPGYAGAHLNLGIARWQQGDAAGAREQFAAAADLDPQNPAARDWLAQARAAERRPGGAPP